MPGPEGAGKMRVGSLTSQPQGALNHARHKRRRRKRRGPTASVMANDSGGDTPVRQQCAVFGRGADEEVQDSEDRNDGNKTANDWSVEDRAQAWALVNSASDVSPRAAWKERLAKDHDSYEERVSTDSSLQIGGGASLSKPNLASGTNSAATSLNLGTTGSPKARDKNEYDTRFARFSKLSQIKEPLPLGVARQRERAELPNDAARPLFPPRHTANGITVKPFFSVKSSSVSQCTEGPDGEINSDDFSDRAEGSRLWNSFEDGSVIDYSLDDEEAAGTHQSRPKITPPGNSIATEATNGSIQPARTHSNHGKESNRRTRATHASSILQRREAVVPTDPVNPETDERAPNLFSQPATADIRENISFLGNEPSWFPFDARPTPSLSPSRHLSTLQASSSTPILFGVEEDPSEILDRITHDVLRPNEWPYTTRGSGFGSSNQEEDEIRIWHGSLNGTHSSHDQEQDTCNVAHPNSSPKVRDGKHTNLGRAVALRDQYSDSYHVDVGIEEGDITLHTGANETQRSVSTDRSSNFNELYISPTPSNDLANTKHRQPKQDHDHVTEQIRQTQVERSSTNTSALTTSSATKKRKTTGGTSKHFPGRKRFEQKQMLAGVDTEKLGNGKKRMKLSPSETAEKQTILDSDHSSFGYRIVRSTIKKVSAASDQSIPHRSESSNDLSDRQQNEESIGRSAAYLSDVIDDVDEDQDRILAEENDGAVTADTRASKTKRKRTGNKSVYFAAAKPRPGLQALDRVDMYNSAAKKTRIMAGISAVPVPSIDSDRFGIVQEKLWKEPFWLLIAVMCLNKTSGRAAIPVFWTLKENYPQPEVLADTDQNDLCHILYHLGLQVQKSKRIIQIAKKWVTQPPQKGQRFRVLNYPAHGDGKGYHAGKIIEGDTDGCEGTLEIGHIPGCGPYAYDSWRIFCRDVLRGLAEDFNGKNAATEDFQPEWRRVLPDDKELRACLKWMWLREGFVWDPETGERREATIKEMEQAKEAADILSPLEADISGLGEIELAAKDTPARVTALTQDAVEALEATPKRPRSPSFIVKDDDSRSIYSNIDFVPDTPAAATNIDNEKAYKDNHYVGDDDGGSERLLTQSTGLHQEQNTDVESRFQLGDYEGHTNDDTSIHYVTPVFHGSKSGTTTAKSRRRRRAVRKSSGR